MTPIHSLGTSPAASRLATARAVALMLMLVSFPSTATSAELWIGAATADITPEPPVALEGVAVGARAVDWQLFGTRR